jgi:type 1 glutamine amidotransferase
MIQLIHPTGLRGRRLLVCCDDFYHKGADVRRGLAPLIESEGLVVDWVDGCGLSSCAPLASYELILLAKTNVLSSQQPETLWIPEEDERFVEYVNQGGRLLAVHAGLTYREHVPALRRLAGGHFMHHPPVCEVTVQGIAGHPLGLLADEAFTVTDEHYFMRIDASDAVPFLSSRSQHGEQVAGWTREEGRGRVCALTPGHFPEVWLHPTYQRLLMGAMEWLLA